MKIIKRGELPEKKIHSKTCAHCKSELEFEHSEVKPDPDPREAGYGGWYVLCPVCGHHIWGVGK